MVCRGVDVVWCGVMWRMVWRGVVRRGVAWRGVGVVCCSVVQESGGAKVADACGDLRVKVSVWLGRALPGGCRLSPRPGGVRGVERGRGARVCYRVAWHAVALFGVRCGAA